MDACCPICMYRRLEYEQNERNQWVKRNKTKTNENDVLKTNMQQNPDKPRPSPPIPPETVANNNKKETINETEKMKEHNHVLFVCSYVFIHYMNTTYIFLTGASIFMRSCIESFHFGFVCFI